LDIERLKAVSTNLVDVSRDYPPLTAEEEQAMCAKHAGDRERLNELLVLHNVRFAMSYVRRYDERTESSEDMWMRGLQGLSRAAQEFDPSRNVRFCTFSVPYIQSAVRDLFDPNLAGPRTQMATSPAYDAPAKRDDPEAGTSGDWLVGHAASTGWAPVRPDAGALKRKVAEDTAELVAYLAKRYGRTGVERDIIRARLSGWTYDMIGQRVLGGVTREAARVHCDRAMDRICRAVNALPPDDELRGLFARRGRPVPRRIEREALYAFLTDNGVEIVDDLVLEGAEARKSRMAEEYAKAEAEHQTATGRRGGADYDLMRAVYMDTVAGADRIGDCSARRGIPEAYAKFLRDKAVRMVQDHKSGRLRRLYEKGGLHHKVDHALKDELFGVADYAGGHATTVNYGRIVGMAPQKRRRDLVTVWKRWSGGFYSHVSYLRMTHRDELGKYRISKREAMALAQFCDDVPAWVAAGARQPPQQPQRS